MYHPHRAWAPLTCLGVLTAFLVAGCGHAGSSGAHVKKDAVRKPQRGDPSLAMPKRVTGTGWHIPWYIRDPKHPDGPAIPFMTADAEAGALDEKGKVTILKLDGVHAKLYREGVYAGNIVAAHVTANEQTRIVIATGGATVSSITNPPDTVITGDTITWYARADKSGSVDKIVAEGNAAVSQAAHGDTPAITQSGRRITFDTGFHNIDVEGQ